MMGRAIILLSVFALLSMAAATNTEDIFRLVEQGQTTAVKKLLEKSPEQANAMDKGGNTPLHIAAARGFSEIAGLLIAKGADINARNNSNFTPLRAAVYGGKIEIVELLINKGVDVGNDVDKRNSTLLHAAASRDDAPVMEVLIKAGADINAMTDGGTAVIHTTARLMNYETLKVLIKIGADVNVRNSEAETPLMLIASWANYSQRWKEMENRRPEDFAKLLIDAGAELDLKSDNEEWTALHSAVWFGHEGLVKLLLESGAKISAEHSHGETPLDFARKQGRKNIIELLENYNKK